MSLWELMVICALLNFMAYVWSAYLWFFVFLSLIPLLYGVLIYPAAFRAGFVWGFYVALLHCGVPLSCAFASFFGVGAILQMVLLIGVALYVGVHAGVFFFCADYVYRRVCGYSDKKYHIMIRCVLMSVAISFFSLWLSDYCFWICGRPEGFIFAHALMLFGDHTEYIQQLVQYVNLSGTVVLLVLLQGAFVLACISRTKLAIRLFCMCTAPWVWSYATRHDDSFLPAWHERVVYLPRVYLEKNALDSAQRLHNDIVELSRHTKRDIILMPEAVICGCTHQAREAVRMMPPALHVIVGIGCCEHEARYNSVVYIHDTEIVYRFDKQFLALFTENAPRFFGCDCSCWLGQRDKTWYSQGATVRQPLVIDASIRLVPYICSELFYQQAADDPYTDVPLLALCGNAWVPDSYVQELFLLGATIRALQWHRDVVYISSSHGAYISKWGKRVAIQPYGS